MPGYCGFHTHESVPLVKVLDYIVVGSGCAGAIASETLVDAKVDVTMLDVGFTNSQTYDTPKDQSFFNLRKNDPDQFRYFIGKQGEGIRWGEISKGAQVTPPRHYMTAQTDKYIPLSSESFSPLESLGYGGLGIGWGLQCWEYSDSDLQKVGLDIQKIREAYNIVSDRIGISASKDTASPYTIGSLETFQPSAKNDRNHGLILRKYKKRLDKFLKRGVFIGRTPLALLTKDKGQRKAYKYLETDFYFDANQSPWRPWMTINQLRKKPNFHYVSNTLVTSFEEKDGVVFVQTLNTSNGKHSVYTCKKLVLCAGALGSARIAMRSQGKIGTKVPLLSNPHSYIPCVQPSMFGKGYEAHKLGFGQLSYFIDPEGNDDGISVASSYSYQSLMLFRIIAQLPFNFADGRLFSRFLTPGLVIMIAQHPDYPSADKYLQLVKDPSTPTGDKIEAHYTLSKSDEDRWEAREKKYASTMRKLSTFPIKRVKTVHGSAIHYAGTLPFSKIGKPLHLNKDGRLHNTQNVYVADSSGFNFLPAKGLTFTLMANAHTVAINVLEERA